MREYSKKYYQALEEKPYKTATARYRTYKCSAKRRGIIFEMSKEQFFTLIETHCNYCGATKDLGVDRVDNNKGYIKGNIVGCCGTCNFMKRDFGVDDFMQQCRRITEFNKLK